MVFNALFLLINFLLQFCSLWGKGSIFLKKKKMEKDGLNFVFVWCHSRFDSIIELMSVYGTVLFLVLIFLLKQSVLCFGNRALFNLWVF